MNRTDDGLKNGNQMKESFETELKERIRFIETILSHKLEDYEDLSCSQKDIFEMIRYNLLAGGKRLRPMILLETYKMKGHDEKEIYELMFMLECIHTYSLVHDDLPCMDNDDYRRGRLTTHKVYGEDLAVLTGDAILNLAFETGTQAIVNSGQPDKTARAVAYLAKSAGVFGMIGGQVIDVRNEHKSLSIEELDTLNDYKTGALISAAFVMGAIMAGLDAHIQVFEKVGRMIGRAFQIRDDILDVTSTTEQLGKPVISDEKNHKNTNVSNLGIDESQKMVDKLTRQAEELLLSVPEVQKESFLLQLIEYLVSRQK